MLVVALPVCYMAFFFSWLLCSYHILVLNGVNIIVCCFPTNRKIVLLFLHLLF